MTTHPTPLHELLKLTNKTVLVTGAAMGIGKAIAWRYAEAGATLQLIDRDADTLQQTATELREQFDAAVTTHIVDLSDNSAITALWRDITPTPDILINNAGIFAPVKLADIDQATFDKTIQINTRAVLTMCQEMIARRTAPGTIINISSIEALKGMTYDMTLYAMSKASVLALSRGLVKDFGRSGWKVNTILPGGISTPGAQKMGLAALKKLDFSIIKTGLTYNLRLPAKNLGQPDDVACTALWLGTPMSQYVNGAEIVVDGGFLAV